jgi:hypothetical protein
MGASGWHHFVPHDTDVKAALDRLQQDVFATGAFYRPRRAKRAVTIAELRAVCAEEGTHSVLDIVRVLDQPLPRPILHRGEQPADRGAAIHEEAQLVGSVAPLGPDALISMFGTTRPSRPSAEWQVMAFNRWIPRGCGLYTTIFDGERASELVFAGWTGD